MPLPCPLRRSLSEPPPCPLRRSLSEPPPLALHVPSLRARSDAGDAGRVCPHESCSGMRDVVLLRAHHATQRSRLQRLEGGGERRSLDSDIAFSAESVDRLRSHDVTIVGGVYPQKGRRRLCMNPLVLPATITFGAEGGLVEVAHVATGFLLTRRAAYEDIQRHYDLPRCGEGAPANPARIIPFFHSIIDGNKEKGFRYLSEDYSFCERARAAGHKVHADRIGHVGAHEYCWEDAGADRERFANYSYTFNA